MQESDTHANAKGIKMEIFVVVVVSRDDFDGGWENVNHYVGVDKAKAEEICERENGEIQVWVDGVRID
jgi:hypothetical protein